MLPRCEAVYLSLVEREVDGGDAFFPAFEAEFPYTESIHREEGFEVIGFWRTTTRDCGFELAFGAMNLQSCESQIRLCIPVFVEYSRLSRPWWCCSRPPGRSIPWRMLP